MRLLLTICCCILYVASFGQRKEDDTVKPDIAAKGDSVGIRPAPLRDSISTDDQIVWLRTEDINNKDSAIRIPTLKPDSQAIYTTPVQKLTGKGIAPMPGTDSLDRQDTSNYVYSPKIIIRTAPQKN